MQSLRLRGQEQARSARDDNLRAGMLPEGIDYAARRATAGFASTRGRGQRGQNMPTRRR